ncbi:urea amidolyase family protein [Microbacterium laevaniformans]|uniref:5-oxoprolinase subunit B/C family protein n=1 Tax=Microbacterium laevaniformans TaxID=36807 RepID=UPI00195B73AD|nr:5-oxoprolinase/urea amidolyase family protein [Microbacterium laevaniformans]MBM7751508.1 KipI family sensor histidine kinase inhibitor [Microbacterium laevaniformans]GLJ63669.1 allophanate hydrolase [Microbacterium laevaniformans]
MVVPGDGVIAGGIRLRPFGERALLAEVDDLDAVLALHARLTATRPPGVVDLVPAARTVLVVVDPTMLPLASARTWVLSAPTGVAHVATPGRTVEIPVVYDGEDLHPLAAELGISVAQLTARHAAADWTVAFTGFAPGFGYLVSADWHYDVPRRSRPRPRVPAGAVALAGRFSGAYPRSTPGGWQLIGTTPAVLFDPDAASPALLQPGDLVRFVPVTGRSTAERPVDARGASPASRAGGGIRVQAPGLAATVQDQGRRGTLASGVAVSGAADRAALRVANRLVGTAAAAAGIEITMGGFRAVRDAAASADDLWFALAGAWGPMRLDGRPLDPYVAYRWPAGAELEIEGFTHGTRAYLAVRGGVAARSLLGSRATDTLAGLGPAPLAAGDVLAVGGDVVGAVPAVDLRPWTPPAAQLEITVAPGPRAERFATLAPLFAEVWTVSTQADRVGIRLDGPPLERTDTSELASEGMLPGAIQVPPDGRPVILGPDGPVTGGYPVVAVVTDADRDLLGQARPGTRLRFRHAGGTSSRRF